MLSELDYCGQFRIENKCHNRYIFTAFRDVLMKGMVCVPLFLSVLSILPWSHFEQSVQFSCLHE